jgi:hypothetical protein
MSVTSDRIEPPSGLSLPWIQKTDRVWQLKLPNERYTITLDWFLHYWQTEVINQQCETRNSKDWTIFRSGSELDARKAERQLMEFLSNLMPIVSAVSSILPTIPCKE